MFIHKLQFLRKGNPKIPHCRDLCETVTQEVLSSLCLSQGANPTGNPKPCTWSPRVNMSRGAWVLHDACLKEMGGS